MPNGAIRLTLLTFPQRWEAGTLLVRFLCLPKGDPQAPLQAGEPSFAEANLVYKANLIPSLEHLPQAADATGVGPLVLDESPVNKAALFEVLRQRFTIVPPKSAPPQPAPTVPSFRKPVTASYQTLTGNRELSSYLASERDFECALHDAHSSQPEEPVDLLPNVTWGRLIAFALRQPKLATALGLIGQARVTVPDPTSFAGGGWLYIDLHPTSDYAATVPTLKACYAARIPPFEGDRALFAAVLFPVDGPGVADEFSPEAERYDSGFARMVHGAQSEDPGAQSEDHGDAIRLAWDDEQVAEWLNRQVDPAIDVPMGTAGFRVDVRRQGDSDWNSLQRVVSVGDLMLGPHSLGPFAGEAVLEVVPAQIAPGRAGEFWMPPYFATWQGTSLALTDPKLAELHQDPELENSDFAAHRLGRESTFVPVDDTAVPLRYGQTYEFRVRLADLTRGGPPSTDLTPDSSDTITTVSFQRRRRPGLINVIKRPTPAEARVILAKPRLGYPDVLFTRDADTGLVTFDKLVADAHTPAEREMSLPDPDVLSVEIQVEVRTLDGDTAPYLPLYTTTREFASAPETPEQLTIDLQLEDRATLDTFDDDQPNNGPLAVPTARDVRLTLTGIGRKDVGYFASEEARRGVPITVELRAAAQGEVALFGPMDTPLRSFFFQPPPDEESVPRPAERLAEELGLDHNGLTLAGRAGRRTVMACSATLSHTLSPERSAITLASGADVIQRWINVLRFKIARDWTWGGLAEAGIAVQRRVKRPNQPDVAELAGTIRLPHVLAPTATEGIPGDLDPRSPVRQSTEILFFDAVDPKPKPGDHPSEITVEYEIAPAFKGDVPPPESVRESVLLPVTTPPVQVPRLVSAGIALSEYEAADDYSSTEPRRRMLWLEFEAPPADPGDAYFVRVVASAPDPMLTDEEIPEVREPVLPIDPEGMRLILPGQPRDDNGLRAMQRADRQADAGPHYLIPLPEGMTVASLELFGMFTYEIRLGHTESRWSTAQGRFGPPLRVAGVQHPAPPLVCQAARSKDSIRLRAPFATPVHDGRNVRTRFPKTAMWGLLYARVRQTDAASWRNLLLARVHLHPRTVGNELPEADARVLFGEGTFAITDIQDLLQRLGLPQDAPLTTLAVELFTDPSVADPLGRELGHARMLRVSPLNPVPDEC
jgi:hypothetical protein